MGSLANKIAFSFSCNVQVVDRMGRITLFTDPLAEPLEPEDILTPPENLGFFQ